jgi:hypothetical protein
MLVPASAVRFDADGRGGAAAVRAWWWIRTKVKQGYSIVDIGPDLSRADSYGRYYGMERAETSGSGCPTIPMDWQ